MAFAGKTASIIMPIHSDPALAERLAALARIEQATDWRILVPEYDAATPVFDIEAARRALDGVDLVVADLSGARPSCYFELGFAEALGKPIRRIARQGTEIHQTSGRDAVVFYEDLTGFERTLLQTLQDAVPR